MSEFVIEYLTTSTEVVEASCYKEAERYARSRVVEAADNKRLRSVTQRSKITPSEGGLRS